MSESLNLIAIQQGLLGLNSDSSNSISSTTSSPEDSANRPAVPSKRQKLLSYDEGVKMPLNINEWSIFSLLDHEFVSKLKLVCVFGSSGNEALMVTKDDEVFAIGVNSSCCLGIGDSAGSLLAQRVDVLCGKRVVSFSYGSGPHVLAYTSNGDLYSWGHNGYCQLGNGSSNQGTIPTLVTTNISGKKIIRVACGSHHSMVLTSDGEVFAWGQNNCGQVATGSTTNQATPRKVVACIGQKKTVDIACGQTSSHAVLDSGDVYSWGYNGNGQLGLGNNINQVNPLRVANLQGVTIVQVECGYAHTLALSDDGSLYAWGANSFGQLGTGNKANALVPMRVAENIGRFVSIAATHYGHLSVAQTHLGRIYMWGHCKGQSVTTPMETHFTYIHNVFACFSSPSVTWKPIEIGYLECKSLTESLEKVFDDPTTSDVKFQVQGQYIYVHRAILIIRCEHFRSMFQSDWREKKEETIVISHYSYSVYRAFLHYLYTDRLDVSPDDAIALLDLVNAYCEPTLKLKCECVIRHGISVENAAMLYAAAVKYDAKDLEEFCFRFCLNHMTAVTQTSSFMSLDDAVAKSFIVRAGSGAFRF